MVISVGFAQDIPELTVWVRAGGEAVKKEITPFVQSVLKALPSTISSKVLICTNENDTIQEELDNITKTYKTVKVIFSKLSSFSTALTALAQSTDSKSDVLTLSVGINIREDQILAGLKSLADPERVVRVYGWSVSDHGNDGSCPGKGWYNTAALLDKKIVKQMKEGIPKWIDNGVLGKKDNHTIGGNEEIPIMVYALEKKPKAIFILNTKDPVSSNLQLGTGITFEEKLARKVAVGKVYMEKLHQELKGETDLESWSKFKWSSLEII